LASIFFSDVTHVLSLIAIICCSSALTSAGDFFKQLKLMLVEGSLQLQLAIGAYFP
jgi:hypothetical protein